ncbi:hypothetical protein NSS60_01010 [Anoxybacillus sp. FSL W8-0382]|uniref:Uncharacterized protein n=1 Tax=Anoxybacillus flavithermus TaxID=33934 RepID=A0AAX1ZXK3_9BACL|nr:MULTISPECIES: hypothetical protein [Bacillaceae]PDM38796.1 hypothetical protein CN643_17395 [Parageobacillus yumthangensis]RDV22941.1 hypothetical protein DXK91_05440 [Parageobacillus toebii]TXK87120.1 hypothetical protein FVE24_18440 [Parageobacillus sp. SY1]ASA97346.1 hypothetical protein CA592_11500 [Anoxybacillus flavithermus]MBE2908951.1 hypothetical protein [Anoxybacillus flavithermus]
MNNFIEKGFMYGFVIGITLALIFVPYKTVTYMSGGVTTTEYKEIPEYIINVLRVSFSSGVIASTISLALYKKRKTKN